MTFMPKPRVEIAFGIQSIGGDYFTLNDEVKGVLDNEEYLIAPDTVWVDVTEFVDTDSGLGGAPLRIERGRSRETDAFRAGTLTFTLRNDDRRFDPFNEDSPYFPEMKPRKRIRVTVETGGLRIPLFAGFIEDWPVNWTKPHFSHITVRALDALGVLAEADLRRRQIVQFEGDLTGQRIRRVLNLPEVDYPPLHDIDDGVTAVSATDFGETALSHMQLMAQTEFGWLFAAADGTLTFRDRHHPLSRSSSVVFSDGKPAELHDVYTDAYEDAYQSSALLPFGIVYDHIQLAPAMDFLFNRIVVDHPDFDPVIAEDRGSRDEFLTKSNTRTVATLDAELRQQQASYLLERHAKLEQRFTRVGFNLRAVDESDWATLVAFDVVDPVRVIRSPNGGGSSISQECIIEGVEHVIGPSSWDVTYDLSLAATRAFLRLDDPVYGMLGANRVAL